MVSPISPPFSHTVTFSFKLLMNEKRVLVQSFFFLVYCRIVITHNLFKYNLLLSLKNLGAALEAS